MEIASLGEPLVTSDGVFMPSAPSGQTGSQAEVGRVFAETLGRTTVESMAPLTRDQIVPMVLRDRYALEAMGRAAGEGVVREAGAWVGVVAVGVGALGVGVLLWGASRLYTALRESR